MPHRRLAVVAILSTVLVVLAGCGSDDSETQSRTDVPKGFDVPVGVTITEAGSTIERGQPASVVYRVEERAASAITVTVTDVRTGDIDKDFTFFSLDDRAKKSTPLYVDVTVVNEGPSGLGGLTIPMLAHSSSNTVYPASELVGEFKPCPSAALPESFLKGSKADLCLVYLLPEGETLQTIDLQTGAEKDAIHWTP